MSNNYFEGYYFKHRKDNNTVAFIPGVCNSHAFIQVITNDKSFNIKYPSIEFGKSIKVGNNNFSISGIDINTEKINGKIYYSDILPIKYDIMGPFKYFPMECRHGIISMYHRLYGGIEIEGKYYDFNNGVGYIEKDSGTSFPKYYTWLQYNSMCSKFSIMISIANIPFMKSTFKGCICVIFFKGREYRIATYLGARILVDTDKEIIIKQGKYVLYINILKGNSNKLYAPENGNMKSIIKESNTSKANVRLYMKEELIIDRYIKNVSFEKKILR